VPPQLRVAGGGWAGSNGRDVGGGGRPIGGVPEDEPGGGRKKTDGQGAGGRSRSRSG
jgi:hypothetical protein